MEERPRIPAVRPVREEVKERMLLSVYGDVSEELVIEDRVRRTR
jgi:hypothetical protein